MHYSSDSEMGQEAAKRAPHELESPSKIQKSSLRLESTGERTAVKGEKSLSIEILEQLKQRGKIIGREIAGPDKQEKIEVEAGEAGFKSAAISPRQDEKGGEEDSKPPTGNPSSIAATLKQENVKVEAEEVSLNIFANSQQFEKNDGQVGLQLHAINLNSDAATVKQENIEEDGELKHGEIALIIYKKHLDLLLNYVKDLKIFPAITKNISFQLSLNKKQATCKGLASFLQKVYTQPLISIFAPVTFKSALDELIESLKIKINRFLKQLPPQAKRHYQKIAALSREKLTNLKRETLEKQRGFSYEAMVKMDILSLFFYRINAYQKLQQTSRINLIVSNTTLQKIFDIKSKTILLLYKRKYNSFLQLLIHDYQQYFHDDITLICLVSLKNKISNSTVNYQLYKNSKIFDEQNSEKVEKPAHIHISNKFGFRFSEIVDLSFRNFTIEKHPLHIQLIIFEKIQLLPNNQSSQFIRSQLIKIALEYSVSLKSVSDHYQNLKSNPYILKMRKNAQAPLKQILSRYNWFSINKKCRINEILNIENKEKSTLYLHQLYNNPKIQVLFEVAIEKYTKLDRVQWVLLKIEKKMKNIQPIHISKHEISYNNLKNIKESHEEDIKSTLIIGTKGSKELLFSMILDKNVLDTHFINILAAHLQKIKIVGSPLIIGEFKKRKFLSEEAIVRGIRKFKKVCNSSVYFSTNPIYFLIHMLLFENVKMWLYKQAACINRQNFEQQVQKQVDYVLTVYANMYARSHMKK